MRHQYDRLTRISDSDNLLFVSYNPTEKTMIVEFKSGDIYEYFDIEPQIYGSIVAAESAGSMFQKLVRNNKSAKFKKIGA